MLKNKCLLQSQELKSCLASHLYRLGTAVLSIIFMLSSMYKYSMHLTTIANAGTNAEIQVPSFQK